MRYIFHISDIHIRNGDDKQSRYIEYETVFENLMKSLKTKVEELKLSRNEFIIVVSGDIFHNKNIIGNYGLALYKQFIGGLTDIGKTILFHGNHDKNQNEINQPSLVSSTFEIEDLIVLQETKSFIIDNVGFSYVSIDDTLDTYKGSGRIADLPDFPDIDDKEGNIKYKIALFHGTFGNVKLYNGTEVDDTYNPYPLSWINNRQKHNYALLGDIHLRQYGTYKDALKWGYSGSLVQQNYGEDIINHGYLLWNLEKGIVEEIDVYNPIGMINLKTVEDEIMIRISGKYINFEKFIEQNKEKFPRHVNIRMYSDIDIERLFAILNKYDIACDITNKILSSDNIAPEYEKMEELDLKIDKDTLLTYFINYMTPEQSNLLSSILKNYELIKFDTDKFPSDLHDECRKRNKDLSIWINKCIEDDVLIKKKKFEVKYLEWENIYCYEDNNWIDFDEANHNTFLISGNNGTGKSAIYDVLTLAIWGDITTSKQNSLSVGIINHKKKTAYTIVDIEIDGELFRLYRCFNKLEDRTAFNKHHITMYKYLSNKTYEVYKKEGSCNTEIVKMIGTMEDFLSSAMMTQNMDNNILKLDYKSCLEILDKQANINHINNLYNLLKGAHNKYKDLQKVVESKKAVYEKILNNKDNIIETDIEETTEQYNQLLNLKSELEKANNSIAVNISNTNNNTIINTNYDNLIAKLGNVKIQTETEYASKNAIYLELKTFFKNYKEDEIKSYNEKYNEKMKTDTITIIEKPCDKQVIDKERGLLSKYLEIKPNEKIIEACSLSKEQIDDKIKALKEELEELNIEIDKLNEQRPQSITKPEKEINTVKKEEEKILSRYKKISELEEFCNSNTEYKDNNNRLANLSKKTKETTNEKYKKTKLEQKEIQNEINKLRKEQETIDKKIEEVHNKQYKIEHVTKPETSIEETSSYQVQTKLNEMNIEELKEEIELDNEILNKVYAELDKIQKLEKSLNCYNAELDLFNNGDEYKFNPKCKYCMKRPWVNRISELKIIIKDIENQIETIKKNIADMSDEDYVDIYVRIEENQEELAKYTEYQEWYKYYIYKENYDEITKEIKDYQEKRKFIQNRIMINEKKLSEVEIVLNEFNSWSYDTYRAYINSVNYEKYLQWKKQYDELYTKKVSLCKVLEEKKVLQEQMFYKTEIEPRIKSLTELETKYKNWEECDMTHKILKAHEYTRLKEDIEQYEKQQDYIKMKEMKRMIQEKMKIVEEINNLDKEINKINHVLGKDKTRAEYSNNNRDEMNQLINVNNHLISIIELLDIVINSFKNYRKDLYENHILRNIVKKANELILSLCHKDAKLFEIGYIITDIKDVLHINWTIRHETNNNQKQIISINQASGFQQFAIAMALRMSIYRDKGCNQMFIDEGFTACDKLNLSIVPEFLKGLLKIVKTVVIVSHIDIISDSVDKSIKIDYDKESKRSRVQYGEKPIVSRTTCRRNVNKVC